MKRTARLLAAVLVAALSCAQAVQASPLDPSAFSYDTAAPLDAKTVSTKTENGVRSTLLTFASGQRTLHAEIVAPATPSTPGPGLLFVHWLGDAKTTNHTEFEPDALALARRGATCLLLDAMWSTVTTDGADWFDKVRTPVTDYQASVAQIVDLRRALDLLLAQPGVDPTRIAYVGHDFGSMYGAVLSGVDPRPRYYVLMAGTTTFAQWYLLGKQPANVAGYTMQMSPLDPLPYLHRSKAQGFFFQFAAHDEFVSAQHAAAFFNAAPLPRGMFVYDAKHDLAIAPALADRLAWLSARLFP